MYHLDIFDCEPTIRPLVFDAEIGKLHSSIDERQVVGIRPVPRFYETALVRLVAVPAGAVAALKEALIVPLGLVIQYYAAHSPKGLIVDGGIHAG
ncbi:MAG: hypothetical protein ACRD2A_17800 [Vicinamibacterales bacterium]